jgi:hypothetical protein
MARSLNMPMSRNRRSPPWRPLSGAALLCLGLLGCAELDQLGSTQQPDSPAAAPEAPAPQPPEHPKLPAEKPLRRQASLPADDRPEMRLPVLAPEMLVGLDRAQIALLLGAPAEVREQPPATVWSYRAKDCSLNVFFYPDMQTREVRALAYDVRAESDAEQVKNACFAALRAHAKE